MNSINKRTLPTETIPEIDDNMSTKKVRTIEKAPYYCLDAISIQSGNRNITIPRVLVHSILEYLFSEQDCMKIKNISCEMARLANNGPLLSNYKSVCKAWKAWFDDSKIEKSINSVKTIQRKIHYLANTITHKYSFLKTSYLMYPPIFGENIQDISVLKKIAQSKRFLQHRESDQIEKYASIPLCRSFFEGEVKNVDVGQKKKFFFLPYGQGIVYKNDAACDGKYAEIYRGRVEELRAVGVGSGYIYAKQTRGVIYDGEFLDGKVHGVGSLHLNSGAFYKGQFVHGVPCGVGQFFWEETLKVPPSSINWNVQDDLTDIKKKMICKRIGKLKKIHKYF